MIREGIGPIWHSFKNLYPQAIFGPAHCVIADGNLDDGFIQKTILDCEAVMAGVDRPGIRGIDYEDHTADEIEHTIAFLRILLNYSETVRNETIERIHW